MTISNQTARTGPYNGNGSTTVFAYDFRILDQSHVVVTLKNAANVETVQTLTTNYTVSGVGAATGGNITMVTAPASGQQLTFSRSVPQTQEVDLANRGGVQPEVLEAAYDKLTQLSQDKVELLSRVPRFPVSSALADVELPLTLTANAVLIVNAGGTGYTNGPTSSQISGAAGSADAAAASAAAAATTYDNFDDRYLGQKSSDPTVDNDGDALLTGALYFNTTNNVMMVYTGSAWVRTTPTSGDQTAIDTVNANATNINTVAGISGNVTTVAGISSDVTTVAADGTDIGVVSGISANVTTVAGISADVTTVAGIAGDVSAVAAQVIGYDFSTTTAMADPGSGNVRFNNATIASVTAIAIDDLDKNGVDQSAYVALWDDSTNTVKGTLVFRTSGGDVATFNITDLTDNVGWSQVAVTYVASSGTFGNGEDTYIGFTRAGDKGLDGEGSGDVIGPASATDNAVARYNTTTGKLLQNSGATVDDSGNLAATTFEPTGDTSAGDSAALGYTSVLGAILTGQGSTNDVTLVNDADATVLSIPTGTTNIAITGDLTANNFAGRNLIINGGFQVNQRGYVSGTATADGTYMHDRWRSGTTDSSYAYSTASPASPQTVTIAANDSIEQVIEGANVGTAGTHTISWTGTATARAVVNTQTMSGNFAVSPITVTAVLDQVITIQFTGANAAGGSSIATDTGTLGKAQCEVGSSATAFEQEDIGTTLAKCQRYYETTESLASTSAWTTIANAQSWAQTKRTTPTITTTLSTGTGGAYAALGPASFYQSVANSAFASAAVNGDAEL